MSTRSTVDLPEPDGPIRLDDLPLLHTERHAVEHPGAFVRRGHLDEVQRAARRASTRCPSFVSGEDRAKYSTRIEPKASAAEKPLLFRTLPT